MEKDKIAKTVFLRDTQVVYFTYHLVGSVTPLIEISVPMFLVNNNLHELVVLHKLGNGKTDFKNNLLIEPVFA